MEENNTDLYEKLLDVQTRLKAPKGQYNSFGKYNYRSCEDILEAVKPLCAEVGAMVVINDDIVNIGGWNYVKATATFFNVPRSTEGYISAHAFAREPVEKKGMDSSQVTGATSSYARKYALNALFAIDDTKDADSDKPPTEAPQTPQEKPPQSPKRQEPPQICTDCGGPITQAMYDGKRYSPAKIVEASIAKFGKPLCFDCYSNWSRSDENPS